MIKRYWLLPVITLGVTSMALQAQPSIGGYHVYYGLLQNHSAVSDGTGSPEEAYRYARQTGHLDFFALTDHSEQIHGNEWEDLKKAADQYNQPGIYTTFRGFEWTDDTLGHVAVINSGDFTTPSLCGYSFSGFCKWLDERQCVAFFNHPGQYNRTGQEFDHFEDTPTERMVGIELWNRTDRFEQFYRNNGYFPSDGNISFYDEALQRGWKIGAAGSEDNHSGNWGNATNCKLAVLASENTRDEIYEALKARRFFSTYDKNMGISFCINGREMGSEVLAGNRLLSIEATDEDHENFSRIELIRNGTVIQSWSANTDRVIIQEPINGSHGDYYYLHLMQEDGDEAITSPIRISRENRLPTVSLVRPQPNSNYLVGDSVILLAEANDMDGHIEKVEFYQENLLIGESYSSPFTCTWQCDSTGTFRFQVKAIDNSGGQSTSRVAGIVITRPGEPVTVSSRIATPMDDVEESSTGDISVNAGSTDIELVDDYETDGKNQVVGLRFTELNLPKGVYITNAYVQFTCDEADTGYCELTIAAEATGNATPFSRNPYDVSSREQTLSKVHWLPSNWPAIGEADKAQRTPNLKALLQEIINRSDYEPGGSIALLFTGSGTRTAVAYEGPDSPSAVMVVTYSYTKPNDPPWVKLTAPDNGDTWMAPATIVVSAQALDTDGKIEKVEFYMDSTLIKTEYHSPYTFEWKDVAEGSYLLKAIVTDDAGDTAVSNGVLITVQPEVVSRTFVTGISSAEDDAEESYKGQVSLNGADIKLVYNPRSKGRQTVGLRFNKVDIPRQAIIKKAYVQFTARERNTGGCSLEIQGEAVDDSREFDILDRDISSRDRTQSAIGWRPSSWTRAGQAIGFEQTADLKNIVQEIIRRPGWNEGNSLSFIVTGLGLGKRTAVSYETSFQKAARLVVQYEITIHRNGEEK